MSADLRVIVEGPEDVMVLRKWIQVRWPDATVTQEDRDRTGALVRRAASTLRVASAGGKSELARRVSDQIGRDTPREGLDVLVAYDRDDETPEQAEKGLAEQFRELEKHGRGGFEQAPRWVLRKDRRDARISLARWETDSDRAFAGLPEHFCLERVLIAAMLDAARADLRGWAEESTHGLRRLVADHGWKRSFRIWGAALRPKVEESLYEALFQGDVRLRDACSAAVAASQVGTAVAGHLGT